MRVAAFEGLTDEARSRICAVAVPFMIPRYNIIYRKGDPATHVYLLSEGAVKISTPGPDGREIIRQVLYPEAIFGELSAISEDSYHNSASALQFAVETWRIRSEDFRELMDSLPQLNSNVLNMLARRLRQCERQLESFVFKDARTRIVEFLKHNARRHGKQVGIETLVRHNLTQQDIANFTGTSRQTVTIVLNDLRKTNQIHLSRHAVLIRNLASLR